MRRRYTLFMLAVAVSATMSFTSCHLEASNNGNLDGYWQLTKVDTIGGGSRGMKEVSVFWGFQFRMLQVVSPEMIVDMRFSHTGDSLVLSEPYIDARDKGDVKIEDVELLRPLGINALEDRFSVEHLSSDKMILRDDRLRLYFRKY